MRTTVVTAAALLPLALFAQEHPPMLLSGTGIWKHAIHTASPEAQKFFDQGLSEMFGFNRYEALRSFRKASQLDPAALMPYWGIAMATGPYINMDGEPTYDMKASCAAIDAGRKNANPRDDREAAYLEAAAARCPDFAHPEAYIAAARALSERYPDDLDAATLYAEALMLPTRWHWYSNAGAPAAGQVEAERTLEAILRRWPEHPGANHLYIHAVESSPNPERAVPSAQRLMGITPSEGHMVHMPGHIWLVLGEWELAAAVNERAAQVDREYFAATGVTEGSYPMYYWHNITFIAYARWMQGRRADALKAEDDLAAAMAPMAAAMPEMLDAFLPFTHFGLLRFGEWDGLLKLPEPKPAQKLSVAFYHFFRAMAFHGKSDHSAAAREQAAFDAARQQLPADAMWGQNKAAPLLSLASELLAARAGNDAVQHYRRAVEIQDALEYDEPPAWYYPVRESLGAALLRAGQSAEAEAVFREGVRRSPKNGRMLFGLVESLRAQGKTEQAGWVQREFDAAWSKADVKLRLADL
jgi:tetratricopeptide (TPR) repeat protein